MLSICQLWKGIIMGTVEFLICVMPIIILGISILTTIKFTKGKTTLRAVILTILSMVMACFIFFVVYGIIRDRM